MKPAKCGLANCKNQLEEYPFEIAKVITVTMGWSAVSSAIKKQELCSHRAIILDIYSLTRTTFMTKLSTLDLVNYLQCKETMAASDKLVIVGVLKDATASSIQFSADRQ